MLFVGFQTCIAEDLEALPVETAGTLATTGATEQRAAILMCEVWWTSDGCGYVRAQMSSRRLFVLEST